MSKRSVFGSQFEKLKELGAKSLLDERKRPSQAQPESDAPEGQFTPISSILGQSLSTAHTVQIEQGQTLTVSSATVSTPDTVTDALCEKRSVSTLDTVSLGPTDCFTKVSHALLRGENRFSEPLDFMVYLHLYTYSYGFGRREADMSQAQLERFTGAAKNTIKRSLERLTTQGWIKCVQEFECSRTSRKWRVTAPEDRPGKPGSKSNRTVAKLDPVIREQSPPVTESLSNLATLTVSKIDTYIERDPKEKSKNSLSPKTPALQEYFATVKPFGKRESELRAYQGLRRDYSEEQVTACFEALRQNGVPNTGEPCHSPLGFLSKAMSQVWAAVELENARTRKAVALNANQWTQNDTETANADRDTKFRNDAFLASHPDSAAQAEVIARYAQRFPMLGRDGLLLRELAITAWWSDQGFAIRTG